ncbi:antirestriction protein ArdA [Gymnodinialimonas sp.]
MTIQFHAQPYDLAATGFYFTTADEFTTKAAALRNDYGEPVEEFEFQFIDGEAIDCDLVGAVGINQANLEQVLEGIADWDEHEKRVVIIAVGECGYTFEADTQPNDFDVDIYETRSMRDLAEQFVEEGLFGDIPERLQFYIDYDAIARDLAMDYGEVEVGGTFLIYRST